MEILTEYIANWMPLIIIMDIIYLVIFLVYIFKKINVGQYITNNKRSYKKKVNACDVFSSSHFITTGAINLSTDSDDYY